MGCCHLEGHSLVRYKQQWGQKFIILLPQAAMLSRADAVSDVESAAVFVIKTVRPCDPSLVGHAISMWSAVCSVVPHLQFGERARPHLYINE